MTVIGIKSYTAPLLINALWTLKAGKLYLREVSVCRGFVCHGRRVWSGEKGGRRGVYYPFGFGGTVPTEVNHKYTMTAKVHEPEQWIFNIGVQLHAGSCYLKSIYFPDEGTEMNNPCYWKKVMWEQNSPWDWDSVASLALCCTVLWLIRAHRKGFQLLHAFPGEGFYWVLVCICAAAPLSSNLCDSQGGLLVGLVCWWVFVWFIWGIFLCIFFSSYVSQKKQLGKRF